MSVRGPLRAVVALAIACAGAPSAHGSIPELRRVLVLSEYDPSMPAQLLFMSGLRTEIDPARGYHVQLEYLDHMQTRKRGDASETRDWLRSRTTGRPDVVVALGTRAVAFATSPDTAPWPGVPIVTGMFVPELAPEFRVPPGVTGTTDHLAIRETLALARQLFPATQSAAIVGGSSPLDRDLASLFVREARAGGFEVIDVVGLPVEALGARLRTLPRDSILLYVSYLQDPAGQVWTPIHLLPMLAEAAPAPIFATHLTGLGYGMVGGVVVDWAVSGQRTGEIARRVLAGERPEGIPLQDSGANRAVLDARQLRRWSVPQARVPLGVDVLFRNDGLWVRYRWWVVAAVSALALQTALIAGLLGERRRRRSAETRSRQDLAVIAHLNRVGAIGELAGAFAHELNSPLGAVVNNAQAARRFVLAGPEHAPEVAACLDDIVSDARRAGEVVRRIRGHLRREDVEPLPLDVAAVIRDAVHLVEIDARDRGIALAVDVPATLPPVKGDDVQLVQVVVNLVVNAFDAVARLPEDRRHVEVEATPQDHGVSIRVHDAGTGISPDQLERVFEPFFTTKRAGLGMGLAISRSIVEAHGGTITAAAAPGGGTVMEVHLPMAARVAEKVAG